MATQTFELTTTVPVTAEAAIDFLVDLRRHHGLHPYVVTAEIVAHGVDADGTWNVWRVVERPRLGPFRYTIRFPARMTRTSPTSMRGDVIAARGCTLTTTTHATPSGAGAELHEVTVVTAPRPLIGYMTRQARLAHARRFEVLPAELSESL